ncbi:MAG: hypothetical protein M3N28_04555 [Actinomycetota bacterium]|nr:hypothetical protein [Actinomycetota bacterium]
MEVLLGERLWYEVRSKFEEYKAVEDTRFTDRAEFVLLPLTDEGFLALDECSPDEPIDAGLAARILPELEDVSHEDGVELRPTGLGREADVSAIAIVVGTALAGAYATIVAFNELAEFGERVARYWRTIRDRRPDLPVLSMGALKSLCAADLSRREPDTDGVLLQWAGDIGGGEAVDLSYTGEDLFLILFARYERGLGETWLYVVDAYGRVVHFTKALQHPSLWVRHAGEKEPTSVELPMLTELDDEDEARGQ